MELAELVKKESEVVLHLLGKDMTRGHLRTAYRLAKGSLLGFGLGNLLALRSDHNVYSLILFPLVALTVSYIILGVNRREHYVPAKRRIQFLTKSIFYLGMLSLLTLAYTDATGTLMIVSSMILFASISYSLE